MTEEQQHQDPDLKEEPAQVVVEQGAEGAGRLMGFARRHPTLSVLGAAGVALFGGVEIAAAVLVGAGVAAIVHAGEGSTEPTRSVRERARSIVDRAPAAVKERVRAAMDAVRGRNAPDEASKRAPEARPTP